MLHFTHCFGQMAPFDLEDEIVARRIYMEIVPGNGDGLLKIRTGEMRLLGGKFEPIESGSA